METTPRILLIHEVAAMLRVSIPTINRWLYLTRRGEGRFPLPISVQRGKGRWLSTDLDDYIASQSNIVQPPVNVTTAKQRRKQEQEYRNRQETAEAALEKHRINRKVKGGQ